MTISVPLNYQKRKNTSLFHNFQNHPGIQLSDVQNYIPIYQQFFSLNANNYNSINLNHLWSIHEIKNPVNIKHGNGHDNDNDKSGGNIFPCKLKNNSMEDIIIEQNVFFKLAPLLDPCKYIVGKYNYTDPNLFNLPSIENTETVHSKLLDMNNSSYVDGMFVFLTSQLLNHKQFIHGVDYYGSFLAIKNNFKINIVDDLDYLITSEFFNKQKNILFQVEDYSHLIMSDEPQALPPIKIHGKESRKSISELSVSSFHNEIFEIIFDTPSKNENGNGNGNGY
jgi:hypothetical protein